LAYVLIEFMRPQRSLYRFFVGRSWLGINDALLAEIVGLNTHGCIVA
jgi:hypothetical protein